MKKPRLLAFCERMAESRAHFVKHPLVEIAGGSRVLVENHFGIISYSLVEVQVKVSYGTISVKGSGLRLMEICKEQLVINGQIDSIQLNRR